MHDPPPMTPSVIVSILILLAAAGVVAMFIIPLTNQWFWPVAGAVCTTIALAWLIPLRTKS